MEDVTSFGITVDKREGRKVIEKLEYGKKGGNFWLHERKKDEIISLK